MDRPQPLEAAEADLLLAPLKDHGALALAVSGGADSTCLLWLAVEWSRRRLASGHAAPRLVVLTVDHGLRPAARTEAEAVLALCTRLDVPAELLTWTPPSSLTNLQSEARQARYALMADAMARQGIEALVTAHHRDDQIETFLDRLTRGSGVHGLAAMRPDAADGPGGLRILRPLLSVPGDRLRATLAAAGVSHNEDPSNQDQRFKRVRLRQLMAGLAQEGLEPERLLATVQRMASAAEALDAWGSLVLQQHFCQHPAGPGWFDRSVLAGLPAEVRLRLLQRLLRHVGGEIYPPRLERIERLDDLLQSGEAVRHTLAGCVIAADPGYIGIWREPGRDPAPELVLAAGETALWDGRFEVSLAPGNPPMRIAAAGRGRIPLSQDLRAGFPAEAFTRAPMVSFAGAGETEVAVIPGFAPLPDGLGLAHVALRL